jgi:hypothetical protein
MTARVHALALDMQWCTRCGRPLCEIVDELCDGLPGVVHIRYLRARKAMEAIMNPVLAAFGLPW